VEIELKITMDITRGYGLVEDRVEELLTSVLRYLT